MSDFYEGRMIPLKIADAAVISCNKEIEKLQIENARLKAEVERLRYLEGVASSVDFYQQENEKLNKEIERLEMLKDACKRMIRRRDKWICERRAEVERLRKAGDAMARIIAPPTHGTGEWDGEWDAWNAAKEGKQP